MWRRFLLVGVVLSIGSLARAQKFFPDDPLYDDPDRVDSPNRPASIELSDLYDRFGHIFHDFGESPMGAEAKNTNTLDEVPNSTWFTNRHAFSRLPLEALQRGPNSDDGPDPRGAWTIFQGKSEGLTPGFRIDDGRGHRYVVKLDPVDVPELSSAAEVIATKLLYAIGYNVPENYIVRYDPERFRIEPDTEVRDRFGDTVPLTKWRLRRMLRAVPRLADGTVRMTASKYITGAPLGPFRYYGTRRDDPNDVVAHEDRRELRGLRLFAAWINHDDTRAHNTLDSWIEEGRRHYIRHYLIDFGSTFGSGSVDMQFPNLSYYYWLDLDLVKKNAYSFGLHVPKYRKVSWPPYPEYQSVGRWVSDGFDPEEWRNDYPNPAFVRMTRRDAFWAGKIIMRFTPEELAAIVRTGEYSDPDHEQYFLDVLLERQRKSGVFGLNRMNPVDEFRVQRRELVFTNLSEKYRLAEPGTTYEISWSLYDNRRDRAVPLRAASTAVRSCGGMPGSLGEASHNACECVDERACAATVRAEIPTGYITDPLDELLVAEIYSLRSEYPQWDSKVSVYLRLNRGSYAVVGIERAYPQDGGVDDVVAAGR